MGSEHLLRKATPTGLTHVDPAAHNARLLIGNSVISNLLSSRLSSSVEGSSLPSQNGALGLQLFLPPADIGSRLKSRLPGLGDCNLSLWGLHQAPAGSSLAGEALPMLPSQQIVSCWPRFSTFLINIVLISGLFSFHVAEDPRLAEVREWGGQCSDSRSAGPHTQP